MRDYVNDEGTKGLLFLTQIQIYTLKVGKTENLKIDKLIRCADEIPARLYTVHVLYISPG